MKSKIIFLAFFVPWVCFGQSVKTFKKLDDKVIVSLTEGEICFFPLNDNTIRVQYAKERKEELPVLVFTEKVNIPNFKVEESGKSLEISTSNLTVVVNKEDGALKYLNKQGEVILSEKAGSRILKKSSVQGESCYIAEQGFNSPSDEYLFGTGQFQDGYLNIKNLPRRLTQVNTQISVPFIVSSKGYGLLWHNYGLTDFNPADKQLNLIPSEKDGKTITLDVTTSEGTKKETRQEGVFKGVLKIKKDGKYAVMLDVGQNMARMWELSIDGKEIIGLKNTWLPPTTSAIVNLTAGKHEIVVIGEKKDQPTLYYSEVSDETVFRSPVSNTIDYIVFAGNADEVIYSYRNLTGKAPMMPLWSLGYIHCRERFHSQKELLDNAKEFRSRNLPLDLIVQDWQYWGKYGWNAMEFDEDNYPDPAKMVNELHDMNMRLMVSVWSRVDLNSTLGKKLNEKGYFIPNTSWVDFFNPNAADAYWSNFSKKLLKPYQIDAWWQDATEPENDDLAGRRINNGTMAGEWLRNVYPLYVTKAVYEGSRKDAPDKRVFILTRSGFLGMQRYASAVWTGDVGNDFETLKRQVTSGLNYSITGMPWWTFDAGGFFRPGTDPIHLENIDQYVDKAFQERFLRWFQFATFSPLQRVHGYQTNTEFWRYGEKVEKEALKYLNLRYRLMPYIYSQAADITFNNGTLMRPLVMDFADDTKALQQKYEYMFGPAFLVAPVLEEGVEEWDVYLPGDNAGWYSFWTGKYYKGGNSVKASTSLSTMPLYVKSGSIVPMGKFAQHTNESFADTLEVRVYTGTDGRIELYEDEGTNYNYEKGDYSIIPFEWNEQKQTLVIGKREGDFKGMLKERVFKIVWVNKSKGLGIGISKADRLINYGGKEVIIRKD